MRTLTAPSGDGSTPSHIASQIDAAQRVRYVPGLSWWVGQERATKPLATPTRAGAAEGLMLTTMIKSQSGP
jgi:hypothetical protein